MAGIASPYSDVNAYADQYANMGTGIPKSVPYKDPNTGMYSVRYTDAAGNIIPIGVLNASPSDKKPETPPPTTPQTPTPPTTATGLPDYQWRPPYDRGGTRGGQDGFNGNSHAQGSVWDGSVPSGGFIDGTTQPGKIGIAGFSGGTAVGNDFNLHDVAVWDGLDAIGGLVGGFVGVPGMGYAASKIGDMMGVDMRYNLADMGLQGISVAQVLANPDNFSSRQVAAAEAAAKAEQAGQVRQSGGDFGDSADPSTRMYGIRDASGNYVDTGIAESTGRSFGAVPLPAHKPSAPGGLGAPNLNQSLQDHPENLGAAQAAARGMSQADRDAVNRSLDQAARDNPNIF